MYTELKTVFVMLCKDPFLGWGGGGVGVGWGAVVPCIIGYYFNTFY